MPKVFVVNLAGHDYTPAEKYGEIKFLIKGYVSLQSLDRVIFEVIQALEETTKDDYCLVSGTAFLNAITAALWIQKHGIVKFLVYDFKAEVYRETRISEWHNRIPSNDVSTSIDQPSNGLKDSILEDHSPP